MILAEAIKILKELHGSRSDYFTIHDYSALQLGIEAMKKLELDRQTSIHEFEPLLPGEEKGDAPMLLYGTIIGKDVRQWGE